MKCIACGFRIPGKDTRLIDGHNVLHVICYECGYEWVE